MVKRRKKNLKKKKGLFGNSFNFWDLLLLVLVTGYGIYIFTTEGMTGFINLIGRGLFYAIVIGWIIKFLIKKAKG